MGDSPVTDDLSGIEKNGPIKASDPPSPDSCYGVSKAFGEDLADTTACFTVYSSWHFESAGQHPGLRPNG